MNRLAVLIPGWGSVVPYMQRSKLKKGFQENGYDVAAIGPYPDFGLGCIKDNASRVNHVLEPYRHREMVFVGHSMGGLVARELISSFDYAPKALITLGTPNNGAKLASLLNSVSVAMEQMNVNSPFITELNAKPPQMPSLTISGSIDYVAKHDKVDWAEHVEVPKTTHLRLAFSERTFWEAWSWLTYDVYGEPGPYRDGEGDFTHLLLPDLVPDKLYVDELFGNKPVFWR